MLSGPGRSTVVSGPAASRARSAVTFSPLRVEAKHGERETVQARRQVVEESQRLGIGPVEVVDRQRDGALVGEVVEQPVEAVQHRERAIGRGQRPRVAGRGEQRLRERRGALEQAVALGARDLRDDGLEQLPHAAVGEVALELAGPRAQAREARLRGGRPDGRPEQARLAEPGRSLRRGRPGRWPSLRLGQRIAELRELALALQKCRRESRSPRQVTASATGRVTLSGESIVPIQATLCRLVGVHVPTPSARA